MAEGSRPATTAKRQSTRLPVGAALLLAGLTLVWGGTFPAMKIAASEIPVLTFRGAIAVGAGLALLAVARFAGHSLRVPAGNRRGVILAGLYNVFGGHVMATLSTQLISSGQTALIMYTMPIWTFLIGIPVLRERPPRALWIGLALGIAGIALIGVQHSGDSWISPGILLALVGASAWACGTIVNKSVAWRMPLSVMTGWQFLIGGVPMCMFALLELDQLAPVSARALTAAAFMMVLALAWGHWAFFRIIDMVPASVAALSVLAVPGVALLLGPVLVDESITWIDAAAFALIAGALTTVLPLPKFGWPGATR